MNTLESLPVTLDDVLEAQKLLDGIITRTPVESSRALGSMIGGEVFLKCENLQRAGSFKVRGAYVRMAKLSPEEKKRGVVAASASERGRSFAWSCSSCKLFWPRWLRCFRIKITPISFMLMCTADVS